MIFSANFMNVLLINLQWLFTNIMQIMFGRGDLEAEYAGQVGD